MEMLLLDNIEVCYGKIKVIDSFSLRVKAGQTVVLLGANGTGKTTILNSISGFLPPRKGKIKYKGELISGLRPDQTMKMGIIQVSQDRDLFPDLFVFDNLVLGALMQRDKNQISKSFKQVYDYFPILEERKKQLAKSLSGGEQQMLAIGRALMGRPELMLLDEPTTGLAPMVARDIGEIIRTIKREGTTVLLVEQNAVMAIELADYFYILRDGKCVKEGDTASLPKDLKSVFREYYI